MSLAIGNLKQLIAITLNFQLYYTQQSKFYMFQLDAIW